jgi:hypothetical protein
MTVWFEKSQCLRTLARSTQHMEAQGSAGGAERQIAQQLSAFGFSGSSGSSL